MSTLKGVGQILLLLGVLTLFVCPEVGIAAEGPTLSPTTITKYVTPLVIPPVMPYATRDSSMTVYNIAARQFQQQILPAGMPKTTVWGYGDANGPAPGLPGSTFNYPAFTVENRSNALVRVKWINGLVDTSGKFLPHLLPVDPTLMWANPPGPPDMRPEFIATPTPYIGPVPLVTHVHGAHVPSVSDGNPRSWWLPDATNIPAGYYTQGTYFNTVAPAEAGAAWFEYPNSQPASTIWYHDHAMGMTRVNVYAGLAGFWLIRDDYEDSLKLPGPSPRLGDAPGTKYYEIPMAIQDKSFNADGSLFYPSSRTFFGDYEGPFIPDSNVSPIWNPEFFGNTMMVNGNTWPYLNVEPRKYRFRLLNGCNARTLILKIVTNPKATRPAAAAIRFSQIGNEGGLIPNGPIVLDQLLMGPAERADVIVDFSRLTVGDMVYLINEGPDDPFGGFPVTSADVNTTGQVMLFKVVAASGADTSVLPAAGSLHPTYGTMGPVAKTRDLLLKELARLPEDAPSEVHLGTAEEGPLAFMDMVTETPMLNDTEVWRFVNLTVDGHPIHLHLVTFEVLGRLPINVDAYSAAEEAYLNNRSLPRPDPAAFASGPQLPPNTWEAGRKDTVIALPGYVTMVKAKFDMSGLYVWHCHIIEHEDNEMMRPFLVLDNQCSSFDVATTSVHVPCVDLGAPYSIDMPMVNTNPVQFSLAGLVQGQSANNCATYNFLSGVLHLPCVDVLGTRYTVDFSTTSSPGGSVAFELQNIQVAP